MTRKRKLAAGGGVATSLQDNYCKENTNNYRDSQLQRTRPETDLTAFLKRYKLDLLLHPYDNHISRLVNATDIIFEKVWGY